MIMAEVIGWVDPDTTTLTQLKKTLDELSIDDKYEGDRIEFTTYGEILCHDIEDEDVSALIQSFDEIGCWPKINVYYAKYETPHENMCREKLKLLNNDYAALWNWIKSIVKAVG